MNISESEKLTCVKETVAVDPAARMFCWLRFLTLDVISWAENGKIQNISKYRIISQAHKNIEQLHGPFS
jgi:hypothetical protein